jgi:hypothetical protein
MEGVQGEEGPDSGLIALISPPAGALVKPAPVQGAVLASSKAKMPKRGHAGAFPPVLSVENRQARIVGSTVVGRIDRPFVRRIRIVSIEDQYPAFIECEFGRLCRLRRPLRSGFAILEALSRGGSPRRVLPLGASRRVKGEC